MSYRRRAKRIGDPPEPDVKIEFQKSPSRKRGIARRIKNYDYMKYWKVIRRWAMVKYGWNMADMDALFFLYSENYFSKERFREYNFILGYGGDRLEKLIYQGWIVLWREKTPSRAALYTLSHKASKAISVVYDKLNGDAFSEDPKLNKIFSKKAHAVDKRCAVFMMKLNVERKKLQYLDRESRDNKNH